MAIKKNKTVIHCVNDKGGVGKTVSFTSIVSFLRSEFYAEKFGRPTVAAFSADPQNTSTLDLLGGISDDATKTISLIDIDNPRGRDDLINLLDTYHNSDFIIIDYKANSIKVIQEVLGDADAYFQNFKDEGFDVVVLLPLDKTDDSAYGIKVAVETYGDLPRYITLINEYTVNKSDPKGIYHNAYKTVAMPALQSYKHQEATMPHMVGLVEKFNAAKVAYFDDSADTSKLLERAEKIRWRGYREKVQALVKSLTA